MSLEKTFAQLCQQYDVLGELLDDLQTAISDAQPEKDVALVDIFSDAVTKLRGLHAEAKQAAFQAQRAVRSPFDLDRVRQALTISQAGCHRLLRDLNSELKENDRLEQLTTWGREQGGACRDWSDLLKEMIADCELAVFDLSEAISQCWQELTEWLCTNHISVQSTVLVRSDDESKNKLLTGVLGNTP